MRVILTDNPADLGERPVSSRQDCACDCQCACPIDGAPTPVLSLPVAYYLELTPACNNRCPGCGNVYASHRPSPSVRLQGIARSPSPLNGRAWRDLIPRLAAPSIRSAGIARSPSPPLNGQEWRDLIPRLAAHAHQFKLTGGEPTLHPAFAEIVHTVEDRGIPFTLFTNGRWSHPAGLIQLLRDATTCEGLLISLHGPDRTTHERFSGVPGSFDQTVANIRRAADVGLDVATSLVINHSNWDRIAETLDLAVRLGANHVVCNRLIGAPVADLTPSPAQLRAAVTTVESLRAAGRPIRFGNCIPQCFAVSSARGCTAGSTFATIDPWGRMRPCNHASLIAGDLRTQSSVEEVWQDPVMAYWRSLVPADCTACPAFATCHGGCRAQALISNVQAGHIQDPLIQSPLVEPPSRSEPAYPLYAGLRPVGQLTHRFEDGADVLLYKSQVVPVPAGYDRLWPQLDGSLTLRHIERQYGRAAVDWVGALHREGMIAWASN